MEQTNRTWRFIRSGLGSPEWNMAVDEAIAIHVGEGKSEPTVRFYGWNPPSLSIGYFQQAEREIDLEEVARRGIGFVRRPTGGRAVLHDRELTYSIVVSEYDPMVPASVTEAYRVLSVGLVYGFRRLGLEAGMARLDGEDSKMATPGSAACFDSPSWYELVVEGRKAAGSAQVRYHGALLQHGSILLDLDADLLFTLLKVPNERLREKLKAGFIRKAVAINDCLRDLEKPPVGSKEAEEAFRLGLEEGLGVRLVEQSLTEGEVALARQLVAEKYGTKEWNLRR